MFCYEKVVRHRKRRKDNGVYFQLLGKNSLLKRWISLDVMLNKYNELLFIYIDLIKRTDSRTFIQLLKDAPILVGKLKLNDAI